MSCAGCTRSGREHGAGRARGDVSGRMSSAGKARGVGGPGAWGASVGASGIVSSAGSTRIGDRHGAWGVRGGSRRRDRYHRNRARCRLISGDRNKCCSRIKGCGTARAW